MKDYQKPAVYQHKDKEATFVSAPQFNTGSRSSFQPAIGKNQTSLKPILHSQRVLDANKTQTVTASPNYRVPFMATQSFKEAVKNDTNVEETPVAPVKKEQAEHWEHSSGPSQMSTPDYAIPFLKGPQGKFRDGRRINQDYNGSVQEALFDASMVGQENRKETPISNKPDKPATAPFVYQPAIKETKNLVQESFFDDQMNIKENLVTRSYGEQAAYCLDIRSLSKRMIKSKNSFLLFENEED
ncbi:hypothetical protein M0R79_00410 [Ignavigranum ruoffiae]|uniref:hypothetical protein n=1 Tax=Ignavigranum ruoffiae TaxID=89093 RepID=UPI002070B520|nr:hypothetical protein [Ignavigranum ruoffiae]UPQ85871.1 hypothetical protein M0R79_00410 [Ignavigranum ruoffiae]